MNSKLKQLIRDGEGLTVEFKRCAAELPKSVYETVCAFSNRYGGHILLGVEDDGTVSGVAPESVKRIKKDFANSLNNPQIFAPTLFVEIEEAEIDGKTVLWCYVPLAAQLVMLGGKIYDRAADGDMDITRNTDLAAMIIDRKRGISSVSRVLPHIEPSDLLLEKLMPIVRLRASTVRNEHPWANMLDMDILKSAGLYQTSRDPERAGFTLAATLLFGREETILSCLPGYVTDCVLRRDNLDRYDDRLRLSCNLIEAFDQIMGFIAKHTLDRFYLEGAQSVSVRSKIARELVSNTLVHREFTSTIPARVVIERDRIVTDNWCLPKSPGKLNPESFTPQPKNPLLANFFVNIGYADALGSGIRNLYKYTKIYSGGEPELIEGDMFRTIVPLTLEGITAVGDAQTSDKTSENRIVSDKVSDNEILSDNVSDNRMLSDKMSDNEKTNGKMSDSVSDKETARDKNSREALLAYLRGNGEVTAAEAAKMLGRSVPTARRVLSKLAAEGLVASSGANRNRKYVARVPN